MTGYEDARKSWLTGGKRRLALCCRDLKLKLFRPKASLNRQALLCEDDPFSWLPLFNMNGPLSSGDPVEDELTVFYRNKGDGDFEYKVKAHRWSF